jgi:hypothetical protein
MIAQWAVESRWGENPVGHANYFGVKRAARLASCDASAPANRTSASVAFSNGNTPVSLAEADPTLFHAGRGRADIVVLGPMNLNTESEQTRSLF